MDPSYMRHQPTGGHCGGQYGVPASSYLVTYNTPCTVKALLFSINVHAVCVSEITWYCFLIVKLETLDYGPYNCSK